MTSSWLVFCRGSLTWRCHWTKHCLHPRLPPPSPPPPPPPLPLWICWRSTPCASAPRRRDPPRCRPPPPPPTRLRTCCRVVRRCRRYTRPPLPHRRCRCPPHPYVSPSLTLVLPHPLAGTHALSLRLSALAERLCRWRRTPLWRAPEAHCYGGRPTEHNGSSKAERDGTGNAHTTQREQAAAKKAAEQERKAAQADQARAKAQEAAERKAAQEEARQAKAEEAAGRKAAQEEDRQAKAEEAAERKAAQEEARQAKAQAAAEAKAAAAEARAEAQAARGSQRVSREAAAAPAPAKKSGGTFRSACASFPHASCMPHPHNKLDASSGRRSGQRTRKCPAGMPGFWLALHRLPLFGSPTHYIHMSNLSRHLPSAAFSASLER